jgi:hypothetical protein
MNGAEGQAPMKNKLTVMGLALGIAGLVLAAPARAAQDCAEQVLASCTSCHYQTRVCEKLDKKSKREWKVTLKRMLRYGLVLDEAGQGRMLECLVALGKDHTKLCK